VFLAFLGPIPNVCLYVHGSAVAAFPEVLLAGRRERRGSSESQQAVTNPCLMSSVAVKSRTISVTVAITLSAPANLKV